MKEWVSLMAKTGRSRGAANAATIVAAQKEVEQAVAKVRSFLKPDEVNSEAKLADDAILKAKGRISSYAMCALLVNPAIKADSDAGASFRTDLQQVLADAKNERFPIPDCVSDAAREVIDALPAAGTPAKKKRRT